MTLAEIHFPYNRVLWEARHVVLPKHDKTATPWAFTSPYSRIRKDDNGFYILSHKKRVAVTLWNRVE